MNIHELEKLATPGPWVADSRGGLSNWLMPDREMGGMDATTEDRANAKLAAHCRNNYMRALELVKMFAQYARDKDQIGQAQWVECRIKELEEL